MRRRLAPLVGATAAAKAGAAIAATPAAAQYYYQGDFTSDVGYGNPQGFDEYFSLRPPREFGASCPSGYGVAVHGWYPPNGNNFVGWTSLGGCLRTFDVGENYDGRGEIFGLRTDSRVWHRWETHPGNPKAWSGWSALGQMQFTDGPDVAFSKLDGASEMKVTAFRNGGWWDNQQTQPGCCWSGWH